MSTFSNVKGNSFLFVLLVIKLKIEEKYLNNLQFTIT